MNGGYFLFRHDIFDYIRPGEELVEQPFQRLIADRKLFAYRHDGFWAAMDTFKDKIAFDRMNGKGDTPWKVWNILKENRARRSSPIDQGLPRGVTVTLPTPSVSASSVRFSASGPSMSSSISACRCHTMRLASVG